MNPSIVSLPLGGCGGKVNSSPVSLAAACRPRVRQLGLVERTRSFWNCFVEGSVSKLMRGE